MVVVESTAGQVLFLLGRLLFGGVLGFMGLNHFMQREGMAQYAEAKGVPAAEYAVPFTGGLLVAGGLGVVLWAYPVLAAGALATFLLASAVLMHDFWAVPEDQKQDEMTDFLKNVALTAGALALLAAGGVTAAYGLNVGLFL